MAILQELTSEKIAARYVSLPESLRSLLSAAETKTAVDNAGHEAGLTDDQIRSLEAIIGVAVMGFIDLDTIIPEMQDAFDINFERAYELDHKIYDEVLASHREDIDAVFLPEHPMPVSTVPPPSVLPVGAASPTLDLSKAPQPSALPSIAPGTLPAAAPAMPTPAALKPSVLPASQAPAAMPPTPAAASAPKPFMLQKETSATQSVSSSSFKLDLRAKTFGAAPQASAPTVPVPKPAQLELGKEIKREIPKSFTTAGDGSRIVHYTGFKSNLGVPAAPMVAAPPPAAGAPTSLPNPAVPIAAQPQVSGFSLGKSMSPGSNTVSYGMKPAVPGPAAPAAQIARPASIVPPARSAFASLKSATTPTIDLKSPSAPAAAPSVSIKPSSPAAPAIPPATGFIKNAPGVPPTIKEDRPAPMAGIPGSAPSVMPQSTAPQPAVPPKVVNFSAEDKK